MGAELIHDGRADEPWAIVDGATELRRHADRDVRVSVSWKAEVFSDAEAARVRDEHSDDLTLDFVIDRLVEALRDLGHEVTRPADPLRDADFTALVAEAWRLPKVSEG